jgi:DivIVA protein
LALSDRERVASVRCGWLGKSVDAVVEVGLPMAIEPVGLRGHGDRRRLDERTFEVVRRGYDPEAVKTYLADVEQYVAELEAWIQRLTARVSIAEERAGEKAELEAAMIAIFEARERMLDDARTRAGQIEAEAAERARHSSEQAVAEILAGARVQAHRIIQTALDGVEHARNRPADPWTVEHAWHEDAGEPEPTLPDVFRLSTVMDPGVEEPLQPERIDPEPDDRQSRYERTSAKLPSIGEDASKVYGSMNRLRGERG